MKYLKRLGNYLRENKWEVALVLLVLSIAGVAHAWNMFHFPYYEDDEGTYMSQAWTFVTKGKLAPYTYWYDHAPAGWILIGLWTKLTGGFFTFGFSINSGRVLMLVLHVLSSFFLYRIGKTLSGSKAVGLFSVLLFSLTPLGIYFQRRVLLDNIMVFWALMSLDLLLHYKNKLRYIVLSSLTFGFALLSKESAAVFFPVFLYIVYRVSNEKHRLMSFLLWFGTFIATALTYVILALLKGELFPFGSFLGGTHDHVSLIGTMQYQLSRKGSGFFNGILGTWLRDDPLIIFSGLVGTISTLLIGIKKYQARIIGLLALSYWLFLLKTETIEFYIIPAIPLAALATSYTIIQVAKWTRAQLPLAKLTPYLISYTALILILGVMTFHYALHSRGDFSVYTSDQTTPQIQAVNWMLSHIHDNEFYAIDMYGYIDLHAKNNNNFKNAEYYWKVDKDPDVKDKVLNGNYQNISLIASTPQMQHDLLGLPIMTSAWNNSFAIERFWNDGWGVTIMQKRGS